MSVAVANPGMFFLRPSSGSGSECLMISDTLEKVQEHEERSIVLGWRQELREKLTEIILETPEWGGVEGEGKPLDLNAIRATSYVIDLLPETYPLPDLVPTSNGEVAFEFDRGKDYLFSLVVTCDSRLIYAGIFGENNKQFGEKVFSDELPRAISSILQSYFSKR